MSRGWLVGVGNGWAAVRAIGETFVGDGLVPPVVQGQTMICPRSAVAVTLLVRSCPICGIARTVPPIVAADDVAAATGPLEAAAPRTVTKAG